MDIVTRSELMKLAAAHDGLHVSIYLPTHPASPEGQQDSLRLRNLVRDAEQTLVEGGMPASKARRLLEPATELLADEVLWSNRSRGLAVFVGPTVFRTFRVGIGVQEESSVDQWFHIRQLLPAIQSDEQAYILAVSRNQVRLLVASRDSREKVDVPGLPASMEEALNVEGVPRGGQVHAAMQGAMSSKLGKQAAVFHGQGGEPDTLKGEIAAYFRQVDDALLNALADRHLPLILAGVKYELSIFRQISRYPQIAAEQLTGNFDLASDHELHEQARPVVVKVIQAAQETAISRYKKLVSTKKASDDLFTLLPAAQQGRVESLFIEQGAEVTGNFDAATGTISRRQGTDAEDLLNRAAVEALLHGGEVYALTADEMPSPAPLAAVFRY